jgi:hypothetical protein
VEEVEWEEGSGRVGRVGLCLVRREVGVRGAAVVIRLAEKYEDGEEMELEQSMRMLR